MPLISMLEHAVSDGTRSDHGSVGLYFPRGKPRFLCHMYDHLQGGDCIILSVIRLLGHLNPPPPGGGGGSDPTPLGFSGITSSFITVST